MKLKAVRPDQVAEEFPVTGIEGTLAWVRKVLPPGRAEGYRRLGTPSAALAGSGDEKSAQSATTR